MLCLRKKISDIFVTLTIAIICIYESNGFNVSPAPNVVIREPKIFHNPNSSYFGFSINLKRNSVLVGAPRFQPNYTEAQKGITGPGVIYKCALDGSLDGNCKPFIFDDLGNEDQWLGMSMDGSAHDNQSFVACAPRFIRECKQCSHARKKDICVEKPYSSYCRVMPGLCYWTTDTSQDDPVNLQQVLDITDSQLIVDTDPKNSTRKLKYSYGEQGFSVHITENNEILLGLPGSSDFRGLVIRKKISTLQTANKLIESETPDSMNWYDGSNRTRDTSFGFAVSSGYFDKVENERRLLYVASAPKELINGATVGAVYIFDIITNSKHASMQPHFTFQGEYLGEYFGYTVLAEDFDSDGFMDVAIGAPHRTSGAVYIYRNLRTTPLNFVLHRILKTDYDGAAMFGTALSKIGDIDQDGYNDLMVSAPFEGDGAIYIYLGSSDGLSEKPSQKINAPYNTFGVEQMFGHGLSKSVDIDNNNYGDLAIGAPNISTVYIYKSYPVIHTNPSIILIDKKIQIADQSFTFSACFRYHSNYTIKFDVDFEATVKLNDKFERAYFQNDDGKKVKERSIKATLNSNSLSTSKPKYSVNCIPLEASVKCPIEYIYKPIYMEMTYSVKNVIPKYDNITDKAQEFCESCVAVDPKSPTKISNEIKFDTGCKNDRCITNLTVTSVMKYRSTECNGSPSFILGNPNLTIEYTIQNYGETAYTANIYIILPNNTQFMKIPLTCILDERIGYLSSINCTLTSNGPMYRDNETIFNISIDTSRLTTIQPIQIDAKVSSYINDSGVPVFDSSAVDKILMTDFSYIDIFVHSTSPNIKVQADAKDPNLTHTFEIENRGPSQIESLDVFVYLPIIWCDPVTKNITTLIDVERVSVQHNFNGKQSDIDIDIEWLKNTIQTNVSENPIILNNNVLKNDRTLNDLNADETIYLECSTSTDEHCYVGKFRVTNFYADASFVITLSFPIDMKKVADITSGKRNNFVVFTSIAVQKTFRENCSSIQNNQYPYTIISHSPEKTTPLWVYIVSSFFGILVLALISYAMYKLGFFRRGKHEELKQLKRASQAAPGPSLEEIELDASADGKNKSD